MEPTLLSDYRSSARPPTRTTTASARSRSQRSNSDSSFSRSRSRSRGGIDVPRTRRMSEVVLLKQQQQHHPFTLSEEPELDDSPCSSTPESEFESRHDSGVDVHLISPSPKSSSPNLLPSPFYPPTLSRALSLLPSHSPAPLPSAFPPLPAPQNVDTHDPKDKGTPDEWVMRDGRLVRLTGRWPFNCEAPLPDLWNAVSRLFLSFSFFFFF